ncbi:hypothetical protein C0Q70_16847 [Pomacea canaliculata]|uniref:Uncharacterized protein n=1 Tax=Pomacea canaliculata TaxID=400727 RepID=A0A2T7NQX4_POMCA|nr:hypothetical protein C0Q70_16847 [Pomacea canaliculata]
MTKSSPEALEPLSVIVSYWEDQPAKLTDRQDRSVQGCREEIWRALADPRGFSSPRHQTGKQTRLEGPQATEIFSSRTIVRALSSRFIRGALLRISCEAKEQRQIESAPHSQQPPPPLLPASPLILRLSTSSPPDVVAMQ